MKKLAVIGYPVSHSFSPVMHNFISEKLNLPYMYERCEVRPGEVFSACENFVKEGYAGFNVTAPHKIEVMDCIDEISEDAKLYDAVNTVVIDGGKLYGYNTDADGLYMALTQDGVKIDGADVLILGAGGAAKSALLRLARENVASITLINRTKEKAEALSAHVKSICGREILTEITKDRYDILINCTSVGMGDQVGKNPLFELSLIDENSAVFDMIYNPMETELLKEARLVGAKTINGLDMLIYQGILAYRLFTKADVPLSLADEIRAKILNLQKPKNIVLTGYMASGKTTVGKHIASKTGLDFCDSDALIEEKEGTRISEIFEKHGEEYFRKCEGEVIKNLAKNRGLVIATGGGAVLDKKNIAYLRENGVIVNLEPNPEVIKARLLADKTRPLVKDADFYAILARFNARKPCYDDCDIKIAVTLEKSVEEIGQEILKRLGEEYEG